MQGNKGSGERGGESAGKVYRALLARPRGTTIDQLTRELGWTRGQVESALSSCECQGLLVSEGTDGRIYPFRVRR